MAKKTKITTASIAKAMKLAETKSVVIAVGTGDDVVEIPIRSYLSVSERAMMVNDIASMVFIEDEGGTKYYPAFKNFATEYNIVAYFTDISLPADSDKAWRFLEETGLAGKIAQALPDGYVVSIIEDAYEAIEYRKQELLNKSKFEELLDEVLGVARTLSNKVDGVDFPQIMEYVEKNMPELKGQLAQLISAQNAEASATA